VVRSTRILETIGRWVAHRLRQVAVARHNINKITLGLAVARGADRVVRLPSWVLRPVACQSRCRNCRSRSNCAGRPSGSRRPTGLVARIDSSHAANQGANRSNIMHDTGVRVGVVCNAVSEQAGSPYLDSRARH